MEFARIEEKNRGVETCSFLGYDWNRELKSRNKFFVSSFIVHPNILTK